jgi:tetratricopeptide (TPR) repeat protein
MKKLFVLGGILLFLILFLVFLLIFSSKNFKKNNKALKYFNKGDFKTASKIFDKAVKNNHNNSDILINSSGADYKLNMFDKAKSKYNKVISSTSATRTDKFIAYYDLGNVEFKRGNLKEAVNFYKEALKINPNDKDSKYNLELTLKKLNEKSQSQKQDKNKQQNKDKNQENKKEQDLKKQMEQNDKAQEKNKDQQEQENKNSKGNNEQKFKQQKDLEQEKQKLDKQRQEISDKIKDLQDEKLNNDKKVDNKQEKENRLKESEKENKDMPASIVLNYYNESDKNTQRPKKDFKRYQAVQVQKDW